MDRHGGGWKKVCLKLKTRTVCKQLQIVRVFV